MIKNLSLALGLFIFGVLLLTASGHTYSPDEESLVYMTGSFMTRGEWNIPDPSSYPVVGGQRGMGGKIYAGPGLALPFLALPFYTAAEGVASLVDPRFHDFVLRLVLVSLFDPLVTALTAVLLFAWLRVLGASKRVAIALAFVSGIGCSSRFPYFIQGHGAMEVYADEETKSFVCSVGEGDAVTIPLMNYHPVFSQDEELHFIWCIAGERYWVGDKNKDFLAAKAGSGAAPHGAHGDAHEAHH